MRMDHWRDQDIPETFKPTLPMPPEDAMTPENAALSPLPSLLNEKQIVRAVTTLLEQALLTQPDSASAQVDFDQSDTHMSMTVSHPYAAIDPIQYELPLKLARQIVRPYGGKIDVYNTSDAGMRFTAHFPKTSASAGREEVG